MARSLKAIRSIWDGDSLNDAPGNLQLLDSAGNLDKEANRPGTNVRRFCPGSYADVGSRAAEPTEEQKYLRPYFYNEPTPAEVLAKFGDSCEKIDDAVKSSGLALPTRDIKVSCAALVAICPLVVRPHILGIPMIERHSTSILALL